VKKRRLWLWIVIPAGALVVVVIIVLAVVTLIGGFLVNSSQQPPEVGMLSTPSSASTASPKELFDETVRQTQDTIDIVGGSWYLNSGAKTVTNPGKPWTNPPKIGYSVGPCGASDLHQYTMTVYGPPVADPDAAVALVKKHWEKLGYHIEQLGPEAADKKHNQELNAFLPNSSLLTYSPDTTGSDITVRSACSHHTSDELYNAAP